MPANAFQVMVKWMDAKSSEGLYIGNVKDLMDRWKNVVYNILMKRHRIMVSDKNCFPEYGTISDGTPCVADAEAVCKIRVTCRGKVIAPLIGFSIQ